MITCLHRLRCIRLREIAHALLDQITQFSYALRAPFAWLGQIHLSIWNLILLADRIGHHATILGLLHLLCNVSLNLVIPFLEILKLISAQLIIFIQLLDPGFELLFNLLLLLTWQTPVVLVDLLNFSLALLHPSVQGFSFID